MFAIGQSHIDSFFYDAYLRDRKCDERGPMSPARSRLTAFVVDDEPTIASTMELVLRSKGFDARSFVDPFDALRAAQSLAPDLLISDVIMAEMNGFDLAIRVTDRHPGCKVLMFSGQTATEDLYLNFRSQGHDFMLLAKPVHPQELFSKIEELFEIGTEPDPPHVA
jgi:DNA-binding NtrC family response regulator